MTSAPDDHENENCGKLQTPRKGEREVGLTVYLMKNPNSSSGVRGLCEACSMQSKSAVILCSLTIHT
ncbi:hypothetical protein NECAME_02970 [Necator americanus]|uniref:Uncharacterized protein n=1 Tax=Necator americanus TaxID=51031 RepID=W2T9L7_NECAM|nr:hypothetical protein NECAME_02970 [Necator americanus]ETN78264.1 hypothetical protein NECAME_02970 [Necator americanus]